MKTANVSITGLNTQQIQSIVNMTMVCPKLAINAIAHSESPEEIIDGMVGYPGALERLMYAETCPIWLKRLTQESLENSGFTILS